MHPGAFRSGVLNGLKKFEAVTQSDAMTQNFSFLESLFSPLLSLFLLRSVEVKSGPFLRHLRHYFAIALWHNDFRTKFCVTLASLL
jgi:hypothetical protein